MANRLYIIYGGITMKKIISFVLCLILGSSLLSGCSNDGEPFEEKSYTPDTPVKAIRLEVRDREIEVLLSEDEQVHIQYSENNKEYYDITVSDENVLTITSAGNKTWTDYIGGKPSAEDRKITLQIPNAFGKSYTIHNQRGYNTFRSGSNRKYGYFFKRRKYRL